MILPAEEDLMRSILKQYSGKHSNKVLNEVMRGFSCGPVRAGNLLKEMVRRGEAQIDGLKVKYNGV